MAQPATNAKIEELRYRVKTDPKSRLFYPLAEELRKAGHVDEAEQVLRTGLATHPTYLSAWVSLGRVLRDQKKDAAAVEALNKALQLDPGNVVAARILADAYLTLGDRIEAIKKYKLVYALMPADEELKAQIDALDREINPPAAAPPPPPAPAAVPAPEPEPEPWADAPPETAAAEPAVAAQEASVFDDETATGAPLPTIETPFEEPLQAMAGDQRLELETGDAEPMAAAHEESPFETPASDYSLSALTIEGPAGFHIVSAPLSAEMAAPIFREEAPLEAPPIAPEPPAEEADVFAPAEPALHSPDDLTSTITMGDLYAKQGLTEDARQIYQSILQRDPGNTAVSEKLAALGEPQPSVSQKVRKLETWLARMSRREVGSV